MGVVASMTMDDGSPRALFYQGGQRADVSVQMLFDCLNSCGEQAAKAERADDGEAYL